MTSIDINCDMGEGMPNDAAIMPFISSANIACGYHAGDEGTMKRTVELCLEYGVAIGAHPSFLDRENFGRTNMQLSNEQLYNLMTEQIFLLKKICKQFNAHIHHVKPHGALYNMAAKDATMSRIISQALLDTDANMVLYGLSNSCLIDEANKLGLKTASEVFADRTYQDDGTLTPRTQPNALIEDEALSIQQVLQMVEQQTATSISGKAIPLKAATICIHGDGKHAASFAQQIHQSLKQRNIAIKAI
jgi:UPF0271 protein